MPNIIPYDDSPIVDEQALAEEHHVLVDQLKASLYVGQAGFIKAGQYLSEIREKETYKYEDASRDTTWKEFCSRPDLPLSGMSPEGRVRTSQKLMTVWNNIASRPEVDEKLLSRIGYTKLALVAGVMNKDPNADLNEWLDRAEQLTTNDLLNEVGDGGMTLAEANDCKHTDYEKVDRWKCEACKKVLSTEPGHENDKKTKGKAKPKAKK